MKRNLGKILSLLLAMVFLLGMMPMAMAETALTAPAGITFDKYLVMDESANVPHATFSFAVAPIGADIPASGAKPQILKGVGTPTVSQAVFTPADSATTTVAIDDTITLAAGKKYAAKELTISFAGITFTAPGIYRYTITESGDSTNFGVTNDTVNPLYLDVYVNSDGTALSLQGYVLHDEDDVPDAVGDSGPDFKPTLANKSTGFENTYNTIDLTLNKQVTGNQGFRSKDYKFKVTISVAPAGTKFDVTGSKAAYTPSGEVNTAGGAQLTMPATGDLVVYYYLQHDDTIVIQGLPSGASYTVEEVIDNNEGYTVSYIDYVTGAAKPGSGTEAKTDGPVTTATDDKTVEFTNYRQGIVPTGILLDIWPYGLMVAFAMASLLMISSGKRRRAYR